MVTPTDKVSPTYELSFIYVGHITFSIPNHFLDLFTHPVKAIIILFA